MGKMGRWVHHRMEFSRRSGECREICLTNRFITAKINYMKLSKIASLMGKKGGKNSAKVRFAGMTEQQISETMKGVRMSTCKDKETWNKMSQEMLDNLNRNSHSDS
jgi:hypothetical protein